MGWGTSIQVVALPVARFVMVMLASGDGAAFGGVAAGGADVVGDVLVIIACVSRSPVVNRAMSPLRLAQEVSVTVWLMLLVRAMWLSCQASVALVTLMVVCWRW